MTTAVLQVAGEQLSSLGYRVITASNGAEAIDRLLRALFIRLMVVRRARVLLPFGEADT
jgi:CheY-like chemotaxis protein